MIDFKFRYIGALAMGLAVAIMVAPSAEARRGGSFGSRGARTYSAPAQTPTAQKYVPPVQRSMAPNQKATPANGQTTQATKPASRFGGLFGGLGGGLLGGLLAGGLIGALMGNGFGSMLGSGFLMTLLQVAMIGGLAWLAFRLFRRKASPVPAYAGNVSMFSPREEQARQTPQHFERAGVSTPVSSQDIPISQNDQRDFEQLLADVQEAFGNENYGRLRELTTPEVMSYLAEELSTNATNGLINDVSGTKLLQADVSEAWSEGDTDFATIAMRYESVDVMRDRQTRAVVEGDPTQPTETIEIWTFTRSGHGPWRLSAVQAA